jgi:pimeloyl-ACP methyl ester carboxylesterase
MTEQSTNHSSRPDRPGWRLKRGRGRPARILLAALAAALGLASPAAAMLRPSRCGAWLGRHACNYAIARGPYQISAREYPGRGPALVLLHGFPDDSHLYDALVPCLRGRRVVTFDFLGWGQSDKPQRFHYTFASQETDLNAVIEQLGLGRVALVAHDAGDIAATNWALDHATRVASLTLMNGFYAPAPTLRPPPLAALFALGQLPAGSSLTGALGGFDRSLGPIVSEISSNPALFDAVVTAMEHQFLSRPRDAAHYIPLFLAPFSGPRNSIDPLRSLTANMLPTVIADAQRLPALASTAFPIHLIWGARDPYTNLGVAQFLLQAVPRATLNVLANAHHNLQIDQPKAIAQMVTRSDWNRAPAQETRSRRWSLVGRRAGPRRTQPKPGGITP